MKYLYNIGYGSCEESGYIALWHEQKFLQKDITNMIAEAIVALIPILKAKERYLHNFQDFFYGDFEENNIIDWLIKYKGFELVKYQEEWSTFGWTSVFVKDDWDTYRDENNDAIIKKVNEAGYSIKDDSFCHLNKKG